MAAYEGVYWVEDGTRPLLEDLKRFNREEYEVDAQCVDASDQFGEA